MSGGKDGSYIIHTLKNKFKLNPLAVTVHSPLRTPIGYQNLENFKKKKFSSCRNFIAVRNTKKTKQIWFH